MLEILAAAVLWFGMQERNEGLEALQRMEKKIVDSKSINVHIKAVGFEIKKSGEATFSLGTDRRWANPLQPPPIRRIHVDGHR